jgi:ABC-2 type transport system ATP-binding protein
MMTFGVQDVSVWFGKRTALDGVTLDVPVGTVTGLVGGDGAGKTTLLRVLAGALAPGAGTVSRPAARRIGYLSSLSGTYPDLTVKENLEFAAAAYHGVVGADGRARTNEYLERVGLAAVRDRLAGYLSGGMRQKLGVIQAMLHQPELLVLDEPTTGIDPVSRADLWWLIARAAAAGAAVVLSTTYLDEAERAARLLVLDDGRTVAEGTPAQIAAAVPGTIRIMRDRPGGDAGRRAWRRGACWHVWTPADAAEADADAVQPDLEDAVTVAMLARELADASRGESA